MRYLIVTTDRQARGLRQQRCHPCSTSSDPRSPMQSGCSHSSGTIFVAGRDVRCAGLLVAERSRSWRRL